MLYTEFCTNYIYKTAKKWYNLHMTETGVIALARPKRCRRVCKEPIFTNFASKNIDNPQDVVLSVDEYEVIRLVDLEKLSHEECAKNMDISRTTVTEIYESARYKIAECLVRGKELVISGGHYCICKGELPHCMKKTVLSQK